MQALKGALYLYFATKEDIFLSVMRTSIEPDLQALAIQHVRTALRGLLTASNAENRV